MTDREALIAAIGAHPREDTPRLALADWLDEHGEPARAAFVRAACAASRVRPGTAKRAELLDEADDLLAEHEANWLGEWHERLIDWDFRRGFLHRVRMTAKTFLRHADDLFRREPVGRVELVDDAGKPLAEGDIQAVVAHPAFGFVRDCAVVPHQYLDHTPVGAWLAALAKHTHVTRLRRFGPTEGGEFQYNRGHSVPTDGLERASWARFCAAHHLRTLRALELAVEPDEDRPAKRWLVARLADATFARRLRWLILSGCGIGPESLRQIATDSAFSSVQKLDLTGNTVSHDEWALLFGSPILTRVHTLSISGNQLPAYARSPLALRVRDLTVTGGRALERAWLELIDRGPPPRRLVIEYHNPGRQVFSAMRREGWLKRIRELSLGGDSQDQVYSGLTAGARSLFRRGVLPRLTAVRLHELCDHPTRLALAQWGGLIQLESLELTDDYYGRLIPHQFDPEQAPERLRALAGVVLASEADVEQFLAFPRLERLAHLELAFRAVYNNKIGQFVTQLSPDMAERVVRSDRLAHVTDLTLGAAHLPEVYDRLVTVLADPVVLPRVRRVRLYESTWGRGPSLDGLRQRPSLDGLRQRFGLRFEAS